jgi:rubrerythrin
MAQATDIKQTEMNERREYSRRKISIPMSYRSHLNGNHMGQVRDISIGGMLFESDIKHKIGERIQADLDLEVYGKVVWVRGNVVHVSDQGIGIRFTNYDRVGIDEILDISEEKSDQIKHMTAQNLVNAFAGESQTYVRYLYFSSQAVKEKYHNTARLFKAVAHAEYVHAMNDYRELSRLKGGFVSSCMPVFGPGDTKKNLHWAIMDKTYQTDDMYPAYIQTARFQEENGVLRRFEYSYNSGKEHKRLFEKALRAIEKKRDVELGHVVVCNICGFTIEGEAPDKCPLCNAAKERYSVFNKPR